MEKIARVGVERQSFGGGSGEDQLATEPLGLFGWESGDLNRSRPGRVDVQLLNAESAIPGPFVNLDVLNPGAGDAEASARPDTVLYGQRVLVHPVAPTLEAALDHGEAVGEREDNPADGQRRLAPPCDFTAQDQKFNGCKDGGGEKRADEGVDDPNALDLFVERL